MGGWVWRVLSFTTGMSLSPPPPPPEIQTIGRAELHAVLRVLHEVTMYTTASVMCDSECILNGCNGWAAKWRLNDWQTTSGPVAHANLWADIGFDRNLWDTCLSALRVLTFGLEENDMVDGLVV